MSTSSVRSKFSLARRLAQFSLIGFTYFLGSVAALHILRPDYSPISRVISEYAIGPYSALMVTGFIALGLGSWLLTLALAVGTPTFARSRAGLLLLALWSMCVLTLSIFSTDPYGIPISLSGIIHSLSALVALLSLLIAALLYSLYFKRTEQWRPLARPSLLLTSLMLLSALLFLASPAAFKGITERIWLLIDIVWLASVALRLQALQFIKELA